MQTSSTELRSLSDKFNKDYYPLTELLCANASIQSGWLYEKDANDSVHGYALLCTQLSEKVTHHIQHCRNLLSTLIDAANEKDSKKVVYTSFSGLEASQEEIKALMTEIVAYKITTTSWEDIYENIRLKLCVIQNILTELFEIERKKLMPFLTRQNYRYLLLIATYIDNEPKSTLQ